MCKQCKRNQYMKEDDTIVNITVIYDDKILQDGLYPDWGLSMYIDTGKQGILFDTGKNKEILKNNMDILNINIDDIDKIVISHRHWDHIGGLSAFEDMDIEIFIPSSLIDTVEKEFNFVSKPIPVKKSIEIDEGLYSTGEMGRSLKEQSLLIERDDGIFILTGCGHPGIDKIVKKAEDLGEVIGVMGGYHGFDDLSILEGISLLIPCHCTMKLDKIKNSYPEAYKECGAGFKINI